MESNGSKAQAWCPYRGGALAGLIMVASVWLSGKFFGASTTFVRAAGGIEALADPEGVSTMAYFIKEVPKLDWQGMFLAGVFLGALLAALWSKTFAWTALPSLWERRFGPSRLRRAVTAFTGGVVAMFGARLADG